MKRNVYRFLESDSLPSLKNSEDFSGLSCMHSILVSLLKHLLKSQLFQLVKNRPHFQNILLILCKREMHMLFQISMCNFALKH